MDLTYYLPSLGPLNATLHDEGVEAYQILHDLKELDSLRATPQLGIVSEVWHGARHNKWEYTMLTLALLQACKPIEQIPTASKVIVERDLPVRSALSLMQVWALLSPIGHTYWTFTSERALLDSLRQVDIDELLDAMPTAPLKTWAARIIEHREHYRLFHLLTLFRLTSIHPSRDRARWQRLVASAHVAGRSGDALVRTRALFRRVRRLAFLCLDAEYSPSVLGLRLSRVLSDPKAIQRLVQPSDDSGDELSSLEVFLSRHVYLGPETLAEAARRRRALEERTHQALSQGLRYTLGQLGDRGFLRSCQPEEIDPVVRLEFEVQYISGVATQGQNVLNLPLQQNAASVWAEMTGSRLTVSTEVDASRTIFVVQAHAAKNPGDRWGAIAYGLTVLDQVSKALSPELQSSIRQFAIAGPTHELLKAALNEAFGPRLRWRFGRAPAQFQAAFLAPRDVPALINELLALGAVEPSRAHELRSLADHSARIRRAERVAISLAPVIAVDSESGEDVMELDGLLLNRQVGSQCLNLTLLEAKDQRTGASRAAHNALLDKLRNAPPSPHVGRGRVLDYTLSRRGAYSTRRLTAVFGSRPDAPADGNQRASDLDHDWPARTSQFLMINADT